MEIMKLQKVSFQYPNCERSVLDDISFSVERSEFVVLCGKSGCGKTTLLRLLKKNLIPYGQLDGEVCYMNQKVSECDDRQNASQIGFVQQNPDNQIVTDKVWHELAFGLESLGCKNSEIRKRVAEMASYFGIQTWFRKNTSDLSGGQKQLLNLAAIMVMNPEVLILDEPTAQLDPIAATEFFQTLKKINEELGTTIFLSEHRLEEVFPMADRVMVMEAGRMICFDEPQKVGAYLAGQDDPMFYGMPSAMKIYAAAGEKGTFPMTVRQGKNWIIEKAVQADFQPMEQSVSQKKSCKQVHSLIKIENIWFRYQKEGMDILRGTDFEVYSGELFSILGGNGVGKSTLLKILGGLLCPYRGMITVDGTKIIKRSKRQAPKQNILMLPQNPQALFTEITVREELEEAFSYQKIDEEQREKCVHEMLEKLELNHLQKTHPYDLSGGEQQRLALGKILLLQPDILLLDEPTKGLDPFLKKELAQILRKQCAEGVTILMVSHDIEFCAEYADRCGLLFDGEMVSVGSPDEFFAGNRYYTTTANRIGREYFPNAVTCQEVAECVMKQM